MSPTQNHIKTRRVFYIPGFDPMPPRRYRELYRREGARQAEISGYHLQQGPRATKGTFGWTVSSEIEGQKTNTIFECLIWSDIVKASMKPTLWNIYARAMVNYGYYLTSGALLRLLRIRIGPAIAALYPPFTVLMQILFSFGLALIVGMFLQPFLGLGLSGLAGLFLFLLGLHLFRYTDGKIYAHYLMLDYSYFGAHRGRVPPELSVRLDEFADRVAKIAREDPDEILLIGHSSGAQLAIQVLARLIRNGLTRSSKIDLLTLGHAIPMASFLPHGQEFRRDMQLVSQEKSITWADVTAPGDGACFALADPVAISGLSAPDQIHPKVVSAAYSKTLKPENWKRLKLRLFKAHFQYLCAFDYPDQYDYFAITSGPVSFRTRVEEWRESPGKITKNVNAYTDV
ncbi:MAG: hypothetical protein AAF198_09435 [Pseudomonadota bacterium]